MRTVFLLSAGIAALAPAAALAQRTPSAPAAQPPEIVVTASPNAVSSDETPTIVEKVNRDTVLRTGGSSVADALNTLPGISSTGFAPGASRPIIRGMDATRVRMLEDGSSSSDVSDIGPDHGVPIDPLAARSIEVVRGAATLRYGSQAIGGVVNVLNNRVPLTLPTEAINAELTGSYGTVNDSRDTSLLLDGKAGNVALHADGFYRETGDYGTPLGLQQNSWFRGHGESVGGSYFFGPDDKSHMGLALLQYNAKYGIPSDTTHIDMRQTKLLTRNSFDLGGGVVRTLNIDGSYGEYVHDEDEPDGTVDTTFRNKEVDARAELLFGPLSILQNTALGVEVQHRDFSALGEDSTYLFPTTMQSEAAYLFTELPVSQHFRLQASGRVETQHLEGTPASDVFTRRTYTPVSGAIGGLIDVGKVLKLGATFSSTGRTPAMTELFARGGHDGPNTFETGDPNLKIERANSIEGTVRVRAGRFRFDGSIYSTWFNNYIYGDLTGRTCDDDGLCSVGGDGDLRELDYKQQGAHFRGLEGQASYQLARRKAGTLTLKALGDYTRATLDDGSNVPRIPPYRLGGGLDWTGEHLDAGFTYIRVARQDRFGDFDSATPGYNSLNAQLAVRPIKAYPGVEFSIVGQNLTDDVQRNAAALNKDEVIAPGRNIRFVVRLATF